jgi:hypothetical protein
MLQLIISDSIPHVTKKTSNSNVNLKTALPESELTCYEEFCLLGYDSSVKQIASRALAWLILRP